MHPGAQEEEPDIIEIVAISKGLTFIKDIKSKSILKDSVVTSTFKLVQFKVIENHLSNKHSMNEVHVQNREGHWKRYYPLDKDFTEIYNDLSLDLETQFKVTVQLSSTGTYQEK